MTMHPGTLKGASIELKDGEADPAEIVTKALGELQTSIEGRLAAIETKAADTARLDRIEARLNRPGTAPANEAGTIERKAFETFIRRGVDRMAADEVKTLTVATDATGGYLAPAEFASEILKRTVEFSPIRQYARVITTGSPAVKYPRRTSAMSAVWVSETGARTGSEPTFEQVTLTPNELATFVDVSTALLEDNSYGLESELALEFAEAFGLAEGAAFVRGTGAGQPKGLLAAAGIAEVKTGVAGGFPAANPADVIVGMFHKLPTVHAQNGAWIANRNTIALMRQWKDGTGRYLLLDPIAAGAPTTLLGRPVVEALDMPDVAANAYPLVFGDLQGYRIVDRIQPAFLRDPYSQAANGIVRLHGRKRVGADVTHPDRFVKLKVAA